MWKERLFKKDVITLNLNLQFYKKLLLAVLMGILLVFFSAFKVVEEEKLPTENHTNQKTIECKGETTIKFETKEDSWVHTFLDFIPGLREHLFRFKKTDLKKTC